MKIETLINRVNKKNFFEKYIMKKSKQRTESRELECILSDAELRDRAETMAHTIQERSQIQLEKKEAVAGFKLRIEGCDKTIVSCSNAYNNGRESREIECIVELNTPKDGTKQITRKDTGESWLEEMTSSELQEEIDF